MDLKSGYPYWAIKNGLMYPFPPLRQDVSCDVLIVGGGITGALIARALSDIDLDVVVIEQRDIGWGSTAASTALLQYEIDTHMTDLAKQYGEPMAVRAYQACASAIPLLQDVAEKVGDVGFAKEQSLYVASNRFHHRRLEDEFAMRERHGFDVELLDEDVLKERFGCTSKLAILSQLAARVDPYRLTCRLFRKLQKSGVRIFDRTCLEEFTAGHRTVAARTSGGFSIQATHLVFASGYEAQKLLKQRVARNRSSYACVTEPIDKEILGELATTMAWESARPYIYLRSTEDRRLVIGGEDDAIDIPSRRDGRVDKKMKKLIKRIGNFFPTLTLPMSYSWGGTFAETADGLPFFGAHREHGPRVLFAMAYGGNGITYSAIGADLIAALIRRRAHPLAKLFSFDRLTW
jgi:glycine/D-amino acid oxidase-like deaminating enzyme